MVTIIKWWQVGCWLKKRCLWRKQEVGSQLRNRATIAGNSDCQSANDTIWAVGAGGNIRLFGDGGERVVPIEFTGVRKIMRPDEC